MSIQQPVAVVTGASRGIGRAVAEQLADDGYAVVINYHTQAAAADAVVRAIHARGGQAVSVAADVGNLSDHRKLIDAALAPWGRLDVLVNNAGITSPGRKDVLDATPDAWDLVLATNLKGPFFLTQAVSRTLLDLKQSGVISHGYVINISSISAYAVSLNRPDYCIAKAGMQMMTWLFAARLADEQIRVYEICPGVIASDMTAPVRAKYDQLIRDGLAPIRRWGTPADVAHAVSAIVRGAFPFSTGERINVDGGYHIRRL
jgi:NAD(P)-dependent dehydrogenase (short-subunit alcohol dehydrogenase family)